MAWQSAVAYTLCIWKSYFHYYFLHLTATQERRPPRRSIANQELAIEDVCKTAGDVMIFIYSNGVRLQLTVRNAVMRIKRLIKEPLVYIMYYFGRHKFFATS